jgi:hypothetical protein
MGNYMNKEWSHQFENVPTTDEENSPRKELKSKSTSEKKSSNSIRRLTDNNYQGICNASFNSTPVANKVITANFDPRSPSSDIVRTPIFIGDKEKQQQQKNKQENFHNKENADPRSPAYDYKRTPIQFFSKNKNSANNNRQKTSCDENDDDSLLYDAENSSSLISETSILLKPPQNTPDTYSNNNISLASNESPSQSSSVKIATSNLPRHILQRKQIEKLNKNKIENLD